MTGNGSGSYTCNTLIAEQNLVGNWDPSAHSWIANNFVSFEILLVFGISWWFINGCQKLTKRYFATVVPYHYIWSWGVALSIFIINFFDYSVVLYHQFILPSPVITGVFIGYIGLLLFTMWITGKYYSYQQNNQLLTSELTNLQTYTSYVETLYDDLRRFRHDYKNILYKSISNTCLIDYPIRKESTLRLFYHGQKKYNKYVITREGAWTARSRGSRPFIFSIRIVIDCLHRLPTAYLIMQAENQIRPKDLLHTDSWALFILWICYDGLSSCLISLLTESGTA